MRSGIPETSVHSAAGTNPFDREQTASGWNVDARCLSIAGAISMEIRAGSEEIPDEW